MAAGVAASDASVLVSVWNAWAAPVLAGKVGHPILVSVYMGSELWVVCFKNDLLGDLTKDQGGLSGLHGFVHVVHDPWFSRGPRPPPSWRSEIRSLVLTFFLGTAIRTRLVGRPACTCLVPNIFQARPVRAVLADCKG